jgi:SAM-dependent methyltransferase
LSEKKVYCWVCGGDKFDTVRRSNLEANLSSRNFEITDYSYGITGSVFRCCNCGFLQCHELEDVQEFYVSMEDPSYEEGRAGRALQSRMLLEKARQTLYMEEGSEGKRLLDIGAGSGILVEEAMRMGFAAEGVEPSAWLCDRARDRGINLHHGTMEQVSLAGKYHLITIVDVIEHIDNPVELLQEARKHLADGGAIMIVTPDVRSVVARLMGWRWWHFRVAHIGYFSCVTLSLACDRAGLTLKHSWCPKWYFKSGYLCERLMRYFPIWLRISLPGKLSNIRVPVNFFDSIAVLVVGK